MSRPVAVVGVGQTKHATRRSDVSIMGLVREAVDRALQDAGLEHKDIDAVVIGKAPDMLEGVAQPEQIPRPQEALRKDDSAAEDQQNAQAKGRT